MMYNMGFNILEPAISKVARGLEGKVILVYGGNNLGKAQPLTEPILTESGFKPMGSMKVGTKVYGEDGKLYNVTGVFPQGEKDVYKIEFADGTYTECSDEHLWMVYNHTECGDINRPSKNKSKIVMLKDIMGDYKEENINGQDTYKYCVPVTNPIDFPSQSIKLDPYLLGLVLGGGDFTGLAKPLSEEEVNSIKQVRQHVAGLGQKRRIPEEYLFNSVDVRLGVLQGLLETDGIMHRNADGVPCFNSTSDTLIEGIDFIVRSLGGISSKCHGTKDCQRYIVLELPDNGVNTLTLERHTVKEQKTADTTKIRKLIKNIEKIGSEEMQCIMVDNPNHLYLTRDFIVTHNTLQGTRMEKPLVLPFEHGLNAIAGIPHFPINSWSDFKKINLSLTNPRSIDKVKEQYQTIIFDEVAASANYCQEYICEKYDAETIGSGNDGYGLWKEYETEYWREINRLTKAGFTVYFIAHETVDRDKKQLKPKGDTRAIAPIQDLADVTIYLESSGVNEDGKVVKSKAYMAETDKFFARSRFDYMDTFMEEFTAENLEKCFATAIKRQEEADGIKSVTHKEQASMQTTKLDYNELYEGIKQEYIRLKDLGKAEEYLRIVEDELGVGVLMSETTPDKVQSLDIILFNLREVQ